MDTNGKEYLDIIETFNKRIKHTRNVTITFVYVLFFSMIFVIAGVLSMKIQSDNSVNKFITAVLHKEEKENGIYLKNIPRHLEEQYRNQIENTPIRDDVNQLTRKPLTANDFIIIQKDTTEKIAEAIVSIIIGFSILLFVGYVMRVVIVFIKYHMQLNHDYENQKIAFLLSKGDTDVFNKIIITLRNQAIGFEKTPKLLQEKIIAGLIDAITLSKNKSKEDS